MNKLDIDMTKKERESKINAILDQVEDWSLEELISYVQARMLEDLQKGSDTLVQLEWESWVEPNLS